MIHDQMTAQITESHHDLFTKVEIDGEAGGVRTLETFVFRHQKRSDGNFEILISYFGDQTQLQSLWHWLLVNHDTEKIKKWLLYKLYQALQAATPKWWFGNGGSPGDMAQSSAGKGNEFLLSRNAKPATGSPSVTNEVTYVPGAWVVLAIMSFAACWAAVACVNWYKSQHQSIRQLSKTRFEASDLPLVASAASSSGSSSDYCRMSEYDRVMHELNGQRIDEQ